MLPAAPVAVAGVPPEVPWGPHVAAELVEDDSARVGGVEVGSVFDVLAFSDAPVFLESPLSFAAAPVFLDSPLSFAAASVFLDSPFSFAAAPPPATGGDGPALLTGAGGVGGVVGVSVVTGGAAPVGAPGGTCPSDGAAPSETNGPPCGGALLEGGAELLLDGTVAAPSATFAGAGGVASAKAF